MFVHTVDDNWSIQSKCELKLVTDNQIIVAGSLGWGEEGGKKGILLNK